MMSIINQNKLAFIILALVLLALITIVALSVFTQVGALEIAGDSTMRYCVGSGGVCTGGI